MASSGASSHVVLVGMMGSGKTTIGRALAARLGRPFLDSDEQVEREAGRTVPEIWRTDGEPAFRGWEARVLAEALGAPEPNVVAAAGGVVLDPANRERLQGGDAVVVWLRARPATLTARVGNGAGRPLLAGDPAGVLARLDDERAALYAQVADEIVDVDDLAPDQIVERIAAMVHA